MKMINGGLLETPPQRTLKITLIGSIVLLIVSVPAIINLLEASNYPGELEQTQLGFDSEYIREDFDFPVFSPPRIDLLITLINSTYGLF